MENKHGNYKKGEFIIYLFLFISGWVYSAFFLHQESIVPWFYRGFHTQAVSKACGGPLKSPNENIQSVYEFLNDENAIFDCAKLKNATYVPKLGARELSTNYLDQYWALVWRLTGKISWKSIRTAMAFFGGLLLVPTYGLLRFGLNIPLAIIGTLIAATTSANLDTMTLYSDYPNGVWVLFVILLIGLLILKDDLLTLKKKCFLAVLAGGAIGVGLGFRSSILSTIPFCIFSILAFSSNKKPLVQAFKWKALMVTSLFFGMILFGLPNVKNYFSVYSSSFYSLTAGRALFYVRAMHLTKPFFRYNYQSVANDALASALPRAYGERHEILPLSLADFEKQWGYEGGGEDRVGKALMRQFNKEFPADWAIAALSSTLHVSLPSSYIIERKWNTLFRPIPSSWYHQINWVTPFFIAISLAGLFSSSIYVGIFSLFFLLYFGMIPSLYFDVRHFYYLQFIPILGLALPLQWVIGRMRSIKSPLPFSRKGVISLFASLGGIALVLGALVVYQNTNGNAFVEKYLQAAQAPIEVNQMDAPDSAFKILKLVSISDNPFFQKDTPWYMLKSSLVRFDLDFSRAECCREKVCEKGIEINFDFEGFNPYPYEGYSHKQAYLFAYNKDYRATIFFPVIDSTYSRFRGMRLRKEVLGCLTHFARVEDKSLPFLIDLVLPDNWREKKKTVSLDFKNQSLEDWYRER